MARLALLRATWIIIGVLAAPGWAQAHAVGVEAKLQGHRVIVETFYDDDTPAVAAKVRVIGEDGAAVAEGKTDDKGRWSFPTPLPGKYQIAIDAGAGHRAKTTLTIPVREALPPTTSADREVIAGPHPTSEPGAVVSDGPTRDEMTGPQRWLMAGVGLVLIAALTALARVAVRKRPIQTGPSTRSEPGRSIPSELS